MRLWSRQRAGGAAALPPVEGGVMRWPAYLVNAFAVLDDTAYRIEDARRREQAARANKRR